MPGPVNAAGTAGADASTLESIAQMEIMTRDMNALNLANTQANLLEAGPKAAKQLTQG